MDSATQKTRSSSPTPPSPTPLNHDALVGRDDDEQVTRLQCQCSNTILCNNQSIATTASRKRKRQSKKALRRRASTSSVSSAAPDSNAADTTSNTLTRIDAHPPFTTSQTYNTLEEAKESINQYAFKRGVEWSFHQHRYNKSKECYSISVRCRRQGHHRDWRGLDKVDGTRQRDGATVRKQCPARFILAAVDRQNVGGEWIAKHCQEEGKSLLHSHQAATNGQVLTLARRAQMTPAVKDTIVKHYRGNLTPKQSALQLRQADPDSLITSKDVENVRQREKLGRLGTRGKVEATVNFLTEEGYWTRSDVEPETGELRHIVWFHPAALEQFKRCPDVVLFDCTFKTNRYNLPMINFVAATGNNSTIHIGSGLLTGATQDLYEWALTALRDCLSDLDVLHELRLVVLDREQACVNAVRTTLIDPYETRHEHPDHENLPAADEVQFIEPDEPNYDPVISAATSTFKGVDVLLCRWHINKDVLSYARTRCPELGRREVEVDEEEVGGRIYKKGAIVDTDETIAFKDLYYRLLDSTTEDEFERHCKAVKKRSPTMAGCLDRIWWPYKTLFVRCWTSKFTSWGVTATSIVESTHSRVKGWLSGAKMDIFALAQCLHLYFSEHVQKVRTKDELTSTARLPVRFQNNELYMDLLERVYLWPLRQLDKNLEIAKRCILKEREDRAYRIPVCQQQYSKEWGWPCYHELIKILEAREYGENTRISIDSFDKHWMVDRHAQGGKYERRVKEPIVVAKAQIKQGLKKKGNKRTSRGTTRGLTGPELRELGPLSMDARSAQAYTDSPALMAVHSSAPAYVQHHQPIGSQQQVTSMLSRPSYLQPFAYPYASQLPPAYNNTAQVIHNHYTMYTQPHAPYNPHIPAHTQMPPPPTTSQYSQQAPALPPMPAHDSHQGYSTIIDATRGNAGLYQPAPAPHRPSQWAHNSYTRSHRCDSQSGGI